MYLITRHPETPAGACDLGVLSAWPVKAGRGLRPTVCVLHFKSGWLNLSSVAKLMPGENQAPRNQRLEFAEQLWGLFSVLGTGTAAPSVQCFHVSALGAKSIDGHLTEVQAYCEAQFASSFFLMSYFTTKVWLRPCQCANLDIPGSDVKRTEQWKRILAQSAPPKCGDLKAYEKYTLLAHTLSSSGAFPQRIRF